MLHVDVKKVGRIPDGGGWRAHGRNSDQARAAARSKTTTGKRGYVYLHSAADGFTRMAHTEPLPDEKAATAVGFIHRANVSFAAHGISHIEKIVTDNGACHRADAFARALHGAKHKRTKPYTWNNGYIESFNNRLRKECLNRNHWTNLREARVVIGDFKDEHNRRHRHSALGYRTPAEYAAACRHAHHPVSCDIT